MTLHDITSPEDIRAERVEGKGIESMYTMVDSLSNWLKTCLNLSSQEFADDFDKSVVDITTKFPEAYANYRLGMEYKVKRDYEQAISYLQEAINVDSTYAMAYKSIADIYYEDLLSLSVKYIRKAMQFRDRLSDLERYLIEADFYRSQSEFEKAREICTREIEMGDNPFYLYVNARLQALNGEKEKALALTQSFSKDRIAWDYREKKYIYLILGMKEEALTSLMEESKGLLDDDGSLYYSLLNTPMYDDFRDDPRFQKILAEHKKLYEENLKKYGDL
jgi:tetratricopeptide (TPR) repeat protein